MPSSYIFYDLQDHELLRMVYQVLQKKVNTASKNNRQEAAHVYHKIFDAGLHPHGIKELSLAREMRIASSVINLLHSLENGIINDRLTALQELHDEVIYSATSDFRRNTGRVLIKIMKDLVHSFDHVNFEQQSFEYADAQLRLANDFRQAVSGRRRVVRAMLARYHLIEMPEEWDQLTFDDHVHDSSSKGRKTPTHLIMDAWLKGIRAITVIHYNFVDPIAAQELVQAAKIMGVNMRIGIEYRAVFHQHFINFVWQLEEFADEKELLDFFNDAPVRHLMREGQAASKYYEAHTLMLLERYNSAHLAEIAQYYEVELKPISQKDFFSFVGAGQASLLHISEMIKADILTAFNNKKILLRQEAETANPERKKEIKQLFKKINTLSSNDILTNWFVHTKNTDLPNPTVPKTGAGVPDLLTTNPKKMLDWLVALAPNCNISLNLFKLSDADVLELLYDCEGLITHLELFNLKEFVDADFPRLKEISELQLAINMGSAVAIKRLIRYIISTQAELIGGQDSDRYKHFNEILRNIPKLQSYYLNVPLMVNLGTDSTGRADRTQGMGLVFPDTLPARTLKEFHQKEKHSSRHFLPINIQLYSSVQYYPARILTLGDFLTKIIRRLPGCRYFGHRKVHSWVTCPETAHYIEKDTKEKGNVATLGGAPRGIDHGIYLTEAPELDAPKSLSYLNTRLANILKVSIGLLAATLSFLHTQEWWVMAWLGGPVFLAITYYRNIIQSVLGGGGIVRSPLLRWNDYVSWNRICDSLFYSGLSVPLLELFIRSYLLEHHFNITAANNSTLVFSIIAAANGAYITAHSIYRGLPQEALVANIFRSIFAVPVAMLYNWILLEFLLLLDLGSASLLLTYSAALISKSASDTVAGVVEGFADGTANLRLRRWDYSAKLKELFECFARLELLFPDRDVLNMLLKPKELIKTLGTEASNLEKTIIINALDLMYFWMYQPRARTMLSTLVHSMTDEERAIFASSQLVLIREKEISRLFVDGMLGRNFSKALSFYLDCYQAYLKDVEKITGINLHLNNQVRAI